MFISRNKILTDQSLLVDQSIGLLLLEVIQKHEFKSQIIKCTLKIRDIGLTMGMDKLSILNKAKKDSNVVTQFINILEGHSLCIMNKLDKWVVNWGASSSRR